MQALRALIHRRRLLAVLLVACALALKAAVPAGFMLGQQGKVLTIQICADASGGETTKEIVVPASGKHDETAEKAAQPCPYAGLGHATLAGADALLLALALVFIMALGFMPMPAAPLARRTHVQPPLRGPPAIA